MNYALFSKNWCRKLLKKNLKYKSILYNSTELIVDWTSREFQNQSVVFSRKNKGTVFANWKPINNDEKSFLFYLKSSFRSQDIQVFVLTFWSCIKRIWLERQGQFWNLWHLNLVKKQLQYTYWSISQEVKIARQSNLVSS